MQANSEALPLGPLPALNRFFEGLSNRSTLLHSRQISTTLLDLSGQCTALYLQLEGIASESQQISIPAPINPTNGLLLFLWIGSGTVTIESENRRVDPSGSGLLVLNPSEAFRLELTPFYQGQWLFFHLPEPWQQAYLATLDQTILSRSLFVPLPNYYQTKLMALQTVSDTPANLQFAAIVNEVFFDVVTLLDRTIKGQSAINVDERTTLRVQQLLINSLYQPFPSLQTLAEGCNVSVSTLKKHFQRVTGTTLEQYFLQEKMQLATELMAQGLSVKEVANRLSYTSPANFTHAFKRCYGVSPREYRKQLGS
jgi:AraC-like DNA-binding protein